MIKLSQLPVTQASGSSNISELITVAFLFTFTLSRLNSNLLVVFLQCRQVFTGFGKLALFHTFSNIPVNKCTFAVHEVELVVDAGKDFCDGCGIADHAYSAHHFRKVPTWYHRRWLVINATLEACGAPIHELDCSLSLNGCNSSIYILGDNVATEHKATRHVFAMSRVALYIHGSRLKDGHCD